jgi:hypothetical protein
MSRFDEYRTEAWPHEYKVELHVQTLVGGVPSDPKIMEGWMRSKVMPERSDQIREMLAEKMEEHAGVMIETGEAENGEARTAVDAAIEEAVSMSLNSFLRDDQGLYIEGRQIKSAIKEAASIAMAAGFVKAKGWGKTNKGLLNWIAEHVVVEEERVHLGTDEPDGVNTRFIPKYIAGRGKVSAPVREAYVEDVDVAFTLLTDFDFDERDWAMIFLKGEENGLGASRSQGFGRYRVTKFEKVR